MSWFKRGENGDENGEEGGLPPDDAGVTSEKRVKTEGLWIKCEACKAVLWKADLEANLQVCPKCGKHFRLGARERVASLLEPGFELVDLELKSTDPLNFVDLKPYKARLRKAQDETGLNDAIVNATGFLNHHAVVLSVMEYAFIGGSMGAVVGETIARAVDRSLATRHPLIIVAASGGARMMEGIVSLMQLAKISAGLARLDDAKVPYLSVLDRPDDRRRDGQLWDAWRSEYCRAGGSDRLRWAEGSRADDPAETAGGLSAVGVSVGARHARCSRRPAGTEGLLEPGARLHDCGKRGAGE